MMIDDRWVIGENRWVMGDDRCVMGEDIWKKQQLGNRR